MGAKGGGAIMDPIRARDLRLTLLLVLPVFACLFALALAPRADAYIYWTDAGTQSIARANLDGTGANLSFIAGLTDVGQIAVDDSYIYWTHGSGSGMGRARLDGTGVDLDFIPDTGPYIVTGLAVNKEHLFWVTHKANIWDRDDPNWYWDFAYRADVDGTDVQLPWQAITGPTPLYGCAVKGDHLWYTCASIASWNTFPLYFVAAARSFSNVNGDALEHYETAWEWSWTAGVAAGDTYFYWLTDFGMYRMEVGWPNYWQVAAPSQMPGADGALAKQDEYLFWTDDKGSRIGRIKKSGKESEPDFMTAPVTPVGVAADAGKPATVTGLSRVAGRRGALVTITGRHFGVRRGTGTVRFGRAVCGRYVRWSDHRIVVAVSAKAPLGRVKLVVSTKYGPGKAVWFTVRRRQGT